ncbi:syntaxin PM [Emiliania huxleyi CCMP1516]|uniref:Syntaxin N-terminal domain-containing protein n=2 Tax=Emiliania huxleyi TaxID=2903 RepID=A0A0D3KQL3_EMIH1|nr:syntaxin PM [Emiliania huxleyi CCMP1516]EOD38048.1 syntaxin PM [Emiliania huxleyi CCMP1516]|eukprot:XP_005790477.1 syntaxin PM [Emiliania huxleyi CCMP1516]
MFSSFSSFSPSAEAHRLVVDHRLNLTIRPEEHTASSRRFADCTAGVQHPSRQTSKHTPDSQSIVVKNIMNLLKQNKDRLDELKGGCSTSDIEMGAPSRQQAGGASGFMAVFFQEVNEVKAAMCTIRANIARIEAHHGEALGAISAEQGKAATAKLEQEMGGTNALAKKVGSPHRLF